MKITFSIIISCALQFCFAQVDYTVISNADEITSLKKEISEEPWEIYCENSVLTYQNSGEDFMLICSEEGDDVSMIAFGEPGADTLLTEANTNFIRQVMNTYSEGDFEGDVDLKLLSLYSNEQKALLSLKFPKDENGVSKTMAFLLKRPAEAIKQADSKL